MTRTRTLRKKPDGFRTVIDAKRTASMRLRTDDDDVAVRTSRAALLLCVCGVGRAGE